MKPGRPRETETRSRQCEPRNGLYRFAAFRARDSVSTPQKSPPVPEPPPKSSMESDSPETHFSAKHSRRELRRPAGHARRSIELSECRWLLQERRSSARADSRRTPARRDPWPRGRLIDRSIWLPPWARYGPWAPPPRPESQNYAQLRRPAQERAIQLPEYGWSDCGARCPSSSWQPVRESPPGLRRR